VANGTFTCGADRISDSMIGVRSMRISGAVTKVAAADGVENSDSAARLLNWTCSGCCMVFGWEFRSGLSTTYGGDAAVNRH
jgi:hypothetical protein